MQLLHLLLSLALFLAFSGKLYSGAHGVQKNCIKPLEHNHKHSHKVQSFFNAKRASDNVGIQWSGAEHKQLGDLGFEKACEKFKKLGIEACEKNILHRADKKLPMSYGQVLALGDFYLKADKAFLETRRVNSIKKLFKCIDKEGKVHEEQKENPEVSYPDCTWVNVLHGGDYLNVVTKNYEHFTWDNMRAYVKTHERAIAYAIAAHKLIKKGRKDTAELLFNKALYINAFADHFLTDAFAAGHLRVPRRELKNWAKKNTMKLVGGYVGDGLSMILHDFEGKNDQNEEVGLKVKNSLNIEWTTRSDKQLNVCAKEEDLHIQMPLKAVMASVNELFIAYQTGEKPSGTFAATWFVPFPDDSGLTSKWQNILESETGRKKIKMMRDHLPAPLQVIVKRRYIRRMIKNLPEIFDTFNERVQRDIHKSENLRRRLPDAYLRNFMHLN